MFITLNQSWLHSFYFANVTHHGEKTENFNFLKQIGPNCHQIQHI